MSKVTIIGGGTGSFTMLTGLRNYPDLNLAAIVAMTDDGGSSGLLRDEQGALPPGDTRQCLVALSESEEIWRQLFNLRFGEGSLKGHNFGNIFIAGLQQVTGNFETALELAGKILQARGEVIPVTLDDVRLAAKTPNGEIIIGEHQIDLKEKPIESLYFKPVPEPNPRAIRRILNSDLIIICPGDIYTSILPNLMINGIADAIKDSKAMKIYVCNIMTQKMHTANFRVIHFVEKIEEYLGEHIFDHVIFNSQKPHPDFLGSYAQEGEYPVMYFPEDFQNKKTQFIGHDLLSQKIPKIDKADELNRALIRHDPYKTASILYRLLKNNQ